MSNKEESHVSIIPTKENLSKIGLDACVNVLGIDYVRAHKNTAAYSWGECDEGVFCFVGVDDKDTVRNNDGLLVLDSTSKFQYQASCIVSRIDGKVTFGECVVPR